MLPDRKLLLIEDGVEWERRLRPELRSAKLIKQEWNQPQLGEEVQRYASDPCVLVCTAATLATAVRLLWQRFRQRPLGCSIVVVPRELKGYHRALRVAGATWVHADWRNWDAVLDLARRHWARQPNPPRSWVERMWMQLPWSEYGSDRTE